MFKRENPELKSFLFNFNIVLLGMTKFTNFAFFS
ncbi:hypothetical protein Q787_11490 [Ornithobacterium rhinotracheale H06-030791]|nr:hypothetical protein Q785_11955 [Ornithobacterium rhinotracheale ORT-UMN 88]KGB65889.1 hypothetical protein Q787_11490 [Ornithobacterium rhinotracheale H06-030791]